MNARASGFYRGFSTRDYEEKGGNLEIYDIPCIKDDLIRSIFTIPGDRIGLPDFGTRVQTMNFEPNDPLVMAVLREDITRVIKAEPRVRLEALDVLSSEDDNAIVIVAKLVYLPFEVLDELRLVTRKAI